MGHGPGMTSINARACPSLPLHCTIKGHEVVSFVSRWTLTQP
jgi:hypothetical protein